MATQQRKEEHLKICLEENVETFDSSFNDVNLIHNSLPDLDFNEIDTSTTFFGKELSMPLLIDAITGGISEAKKINKDLAEIAEKKKIAFALGSQRAMLENPKLKETYFVRDVAPKTLVIGNIGISQLKKFKTEKIENALKAIKADALAVHINPAQEIFQKEGDLDFKNAGAELNRLCNELSYPVIGKEVGTGICREVAILLKEVGVKAINVAGYGGTNWIVIEGLRSGKDFEAFKNWGIPTPISILESKVGLPIIASGGIRSGLDIAKCLALGADICGIALPFLKILNNKGKKGLEEFIDKLQYELKTAMFLSGCENIEKLKNVKYVLTGKAKDWVEQRKLI
ncbi:MAG: type 2 isopentenyl-diphosphate Delta-isomerase [Candidatus Aenigmatarchaeota archaeon]